VTFDSPIGVISRLARQLLNWRLFPGNLVLRDLSYAIAGIILLLIFAGDTYAQQTTVTIRVGAEAPAKAFIEASSAPSRNWSFRNEYAGVSELANRIDAFRVFDSKGAEIPTRRLAPGQFTAVSDATTFRYQVSLSPPARAADAARVSWANGIRGLLMLADLLPDYSQAEQPLNGGRKAKVAVENAWRNVTLRLDLATGWTAYSNDKQSGGNVFEIANAQSSVFVIGAHLRTSRQIVSGMLLEFVTDEQWAFPDADVLNMGSQVLKEHRDVFGAMPASRVTLTLLSFPYDSAAEKWSAETRGTFVTLLFTKQTLKNVALAQLSVPLTHELFHLWVPNGLGLSGDYDWFYEGFTVYQAARAGVRLGFFTFQEANTSPAWLMVYGNRHRFLAQHITRAIFCYKVDHILPA